MRVVEPPSSGAKYEAPEDTPEGPEAGHPVPISVARLPTYRGRLLAQPPSRLAGVKGRTSYTCHEVLVNRSASIPRSPFDLDGISATDVDARAETTLD